MQFGRRKRARKIAKRNFMHIRFFIFCIMLLAGCGARIAPTPTALIPQPTARPSPTATLTAQANAQQIFPLTRGAQWVYQEVAYDTIPNDVLPERLNRQITATLLVTDTVMETQTRAPYYAARVVRARAIVSTTVALAELGEYGEIIFADNAPATKWYIFAGDKIYSQSETLDWNSVETAPLELQLPLAQGARWYPDAQQRAQFSTDEMVPGLRAVERAPRLDLPFGALSDCFVLHDFFNGGGVLTEFCPGVGIVGEHFDHAGTPFGSHKQLRQFTRGE